MACRIAALIQKRPHLGVSHVRQQLLLSLLELFRRIIAIHGKQVMAKAVHPGEREGEGSAQTPALRYQGYTTGPKRKPFL